MCINRFPTFIMVLCCILPLSEALCKEHCCAKMDTLYLLCPGHYAGKNNFEGTTRKFINAMVIFQDSSTLPAWLYGRDVNVFREALCCLESCNDNEIQQNISEKTRKTEQKNAVIRKKVINSLQRITDLIEQHIKYTSIIRVKEKFLYHQLVTIRLEKFLRAEWPPEEVCPPCGEFWQLIEQLPKKNPIAEKKLGSPLTILTLERQRTEIDNVLKNTCMQLYRITQYNLRDIENNFRYFTWTETGRSVKKLRAFSRRQDIQSICNRYFE
ncbi:hypothetical protein KKHLCK_03650 [Candidatus Electrothrix laxa]